MYFKFLVFAPYREAKIIKIVKWKIREVLNKEFEIEDFFSNKCFIYLAKQTVSSHSGDLRFI